MKKLLLTVLFTLILLCERAYAEIFTLEKCYENTYKQEFTQTFKGQKYDPSIKEYGPHDEVWFEKSYEDYMNNVYEVSIQKNKSFDPFNSKKTNPQTIKRKDDSKVTINTETLTLSFITLSTPIKKQNYEIIDYTDGVVFSEKEWDKNFGYGSGRLGYKKIQANFLKGTVYIFEYDTQYTTNGSQNYQITQTLICQPIDKSGINGNSGASGTAFFVSNKGHLITNNHVVVGCSISKITYQNKDYETKLLATDKTLDLALLKAELKNKSYLDFSGDEVKKMQKIYVGGYPLGKGLSDDLKITSGIVSSLKGFEDNSNEIQIDAAINPGNSGGPIINEDGELVAIAVSGLAKDQTEGINFGIKSSAAERFLKANKLKANKSLFSTSKNNDELLEILEEATVYTYCN
jgi:S1-C subfamily serine protease